MSPKDYYRQALMFSAFALVYMLLAVAHIAHPQSAVIVTMPDRAMTPGAVEAALTKEKLCDPTFHTATARHVTQSQKLAACKAYGIFKGCPGKGYEIDHLISIELGGSNEQTNLWPQQADTQGVVGYHTKDVVENRAHAAVCSGRLTLEQAQKGIATDWYQFGKENGFIKEAGQ